MRRSLEVFLINGDAGIIAMALIYARYAASRAIKAIFTKKDDPHQEDVLTPASAPPPGVADTGSRSTADHRTTTMQHSLEVFLINGAAGIIAMALIYAGYAASRAIKAIFTKKDDPHHEDVLTPAPAPPPGVADKGSPTDTSPNFVETMNTDRKKIEIVIDRELLSRAGRKARRLFRIGLYFAIGLAGVGAASMAAPSVVEYFGDKVMGPLSCSMSWQGIEGVERTHWSAMGCRAVVNGKHYDMDKYKCETNWPGRKTRMHNYNSCQVEIGGFYVYERDAGEQINGKWANVDEYRCYLLASSGKSRLTKDGDCEVWVNKAFVPAEDQWDAMLKQGKYKDEMDY